MVDAGIHPSELTRESVRLRFDIARRSGYPGWLWPDIDAIHWESALREIASTTRELLQGNSRAVLNADNADAIGIAAYTSGMGPLLGCWIESGSLEASPEIRDLFLLHLRHNRERMGRLRDRAISVVTQLAAADVRPLVLKGMHTAFHYFPEPGARPVSDIDLQIDTQAMPRAETALAELGFARKLRMRSPYCCDWSLPALRTEPLTLNMLHKDDFWSLDVQASLNRRLFTGTQIELDRLLSSAAMVPWSQSGSARVLRQPLLTLHLAAHVSQILISASMVRIVELFLVIREDVRTGLLNWDEFLDGAARIGGARYAYPALQFCERLVPGTVPGRVLALCERDAPPILRKVVAGHSAHTAQSLRRYSIRERFMWAETWREKIRQIFGEFALDGRREPVGHTLKSIGRKLWALRRWRYRL